jgi:hypothetical protein
MSCTGKLCGRVFCAQAQPDLIGTFVCLVFFADCDEDLKAKGCLRRRACFTPDRPPGPPSTANLTRGYEGVSLFLVINALAGTIEKGVSTGRRGFTWSNCCDGRAYGGCGAACLKFWKGAGLKEKGHLEGQYAHHQPRSSLLLADSEGFR